MSNKNRSNRGGGGGGGESNKITINANTSGKREDCKFSVVLRRGRLGLSGETLQFRLGTPDHQYGPWITDPDVPANRYSLRTDREGETESRAFDFSSDDCKDYSQVLVVYRRNTDPGQGVYEQAVQLPASETTEGPKLTKKSGKRLKFQAPEGALKSPDNNFSLPAIRTGDKSGNPEAVEIIFRVRSAQALVTLTDVATGKVLSYNGKKAKCVKYFVYKTPATGLVLADCQTEGDLECKLEILHPSANEEATITMEFEY